MTERLVAYVEDEDKKRLAEIAKEKGLKSSSSLISMILKDFLKKEEKESD